MLLFADIIRVVNTLLALAYLPLLYMRVNSPSIENRYRESALGLAFIAIGIAFGSFYNLSKDVPFHPASLFVFLGLTINFITSFNRQRKEGFSLTGKRRD